MGLKSWAKNEWQEAKDAAKEIWGFCRTHDWKKTTKKSFQKKYWIWWILAVVLIVAVALIAWYRDDIVRKFEPHKDKIVEFPASWVIPIVVLVILSFPPLGGHELVLLVVGLIWGVWVGFAIACAGTLIGEILCFYLFKYLLTSRAAKIEQESVFYACIARLMRDGGLWIIIVVRFSAIPGHVVTAIQSTVGMSIWIYSIAVIVSLPKQLAVTYMGDAIMQTDDNAGKEESNQTTIISLVVLFVTTLATILALYIVYMRARKLYPEVLADMQEREASKSPLTASDAEAGVGGSGGGKPLRRRSSLVEAAFDGDAGIEYVAPENEGRRAHGMVRTNTGGTWRSSFDGEEGEEWDPRTPKHRGGEEEQGAWQDGKSPDPARRGYGQLSGAEESYGHLPLRGESEVGMAPPPSSSSSRPGAGLSAPPSYVSRAASSQQQQQQQQRSPYSDPFANPSQQSFSSTAAPYGTGPYDSRSAAGTSSTVNVPLSAPSEGPASIPYVSASGSAAGGAGAGGRGERPRTVGGTEVMTGVGAGRGGNGAGGGQYGATGGRYP
ncbi:hypothetical protein JCM6882_006151 [Rhodosporidiobolus microsporus]